MARLNSGGSGGDSDSPTTKTKSDFEPTDEEQQAGGATEETATTEPSSTDTSSTSGGSDPSPAGDVANSGPSNDPTPADGSSGSSSFADSEDTQTDTQSSSTGNTSGSFGSGDPSGLDGVAKSGPSNDSMPSASEPGSASSTVSNGEENEPGGESTDTTETNTERANQSVSLGTTGLGTSGTNQSRAREGTARASQSVSLGTTGFGTSGTAQSRTRERTPRASQSVSLSTTGLGTERQTRREVVRDLAENQLEEQGVSTDQVEITVEETEDGGYRATAERSQQEEFGDLPISVGGRQVEEVLAEAGQTYSETVGSYVDKGVESRVNPFTGQLQAEIGEQLLRDLGKEQLADRVERGQQLQGKFTKGFSKGAAELLNAPAIAVGAKEAGEFVGYSAKEIATGDGGELASDVADRGTALAEQAVEEAVENPVSTAGSTVGGLAGGVAAGTALSAATRGTRLAGVATPGRALKSSVTDRLPDRGGVSFIDDTRGQADFGTKTKQKTIQRDGEQQDDSATTFEEMEDEGIIDVKNRDSTSEYSDIETEARERLPDSDEYPSQTEFERELTQQMRRIEQRERSDTDTDAATATDTDTALQTQTQTQATVGGLAGAGTVATEATMFREKTEVDAMAATTIAPEEQVTAAETVADTGTIGMTGLQTGVTTDLTTSVTTDVTDTLTTTTTDTTAITTADTVGITDQVQVTETVQDGLTTTTQMIDGDTTGKRKRDFDIDGGGGMDDVLLGGEPGGDEQRYEFEARDLL